MAEKNLQHRGPFGTPEEAQAFKPESEHFRLFRVVGPDGQARFTWAQGHDSAIGNVVRPLGWKAGVVGAVNKERLAGMLSQLTPEERAALLGQFQEAPPEKHGRKK
jgi:hypothetical protein